MEPRHDKFQGQTDSEFQISAPQSDYVSEIYRILVVDDEPSTRDLMWWILSRAGFEVMLAENGEQGLELFLQTRFDMVLTDLNMPEMNGLALAQRIKSMAPRVPIGLVTGYTTLELESEIDQNLINFLIYKPFRVEQVQGTVKKFLEYLSAPE